MSHKLLTPKQTASKLKISTRTLRRWKNRGVINPVPTPGGKVAYNPNDLKKIKKQKFNPLPPNPKQIATKKDLPKTKSPIQSSPKSVNIPVPPLSSPQQPIVTKHSPPSIKSPTITPPTLIASQPLPSSEEIEPLPIIIPKPTQPDKKSPTIKPASSPTQKKKLTTKKSPEKKSPKRIKKPIINKTAWAYAGIIGILIFLIGGWIILSKVFQTPTSTSSKAASSSNDQETTTQTDSTIESTTQNIAQNPLAPEDIIIGNRLRLNPQTISTLPIAGDQYYNSTTNSMQYFDGTTWVDLNNSTSSLTLQKAYENGGIIETTQGDLSFIMAESSAGDGDFLIQLPGDNSKVIISGGADQDLLTINDDAIYPIDISQTTRIAGTLHTNKLVDTEGSGYYIDPASTTTAATLAGGVSMAGGITFTQNNDILTNATDSYLTSSAGFSVGGNTTYYFDTDGDINANQITIAGTLDANGQVDLGDSGDTVSISGSSLTLSSINAIDLKPSNDSDDYVYFTTSSSNPAINFEGISTTNDPGIRANSSSGEIEYRDEDSSTWVTLDSLSGSSSLFTDGGSIVYPTDTTQDLAIGGTTSASPFFVDAATGNTDIAGTIDLGTNTISDGSLTGNWGFGSGNLSGIGNLSITGNLTIPGTTTINTVAYTWPGADGSSGYALTTNGGGSLSWTDQASLGTNYWLQTLGALYPKNSTVDFIIGGDATASATFQVFATTGNITTDGNLTLGSVPSVSDNNQVLTVDSGEVKYIDSSGWDKNASNDITTFLGLTDTIANYTAQAGYLLRVNSTPDAVESFDASGWDQDESDDYAGWSITDDDTDSFTISSSDDLALTSTDGNVLTNLTGSDDATDVMDLSIRLLGDLVSGNGLTGGVDNILVGTDTDLTLAVVGGDGITANADDIEVDETYAFAWTGSHTYSDTTLAFTHATSITLDTTGDIVLDADGGDVLLSDNAVNFGTLTNNSGDLTITSAGTNLTLNDNVTFAGTTTLGSGAIEYTWPASDGTADQVLATDSSGNLSWASVLSDGLSVGGWTHIDHALYPDHYWADDLIIGGNSTASATFQVFATTGNITSGTWTATAVGVDYGGTGLTSYVVGDLLYADGVASLARLADIATGNVLLSGGVGVAPAWGQVVLGTHTTGNYVSSLTGTTNQITVSASTGDVTLSIPSDFRAPGTVNAVTGIYTGTTAGTQRLDSNGNLVNIGNFTSTGTTNFNGVTYTWPGADGTTDYVLSTNGTGTLSWVEQSGSGGSTTYWSEALGTLYPSNSTTDLLIGGTATASAKFAFLNMNTGTPTFSMENQASAIDLVDTTVNALSIESGLMSFDTTNSRVGIGTTEPGYKLEVAGTSSDDVFKITSTRNIAGASVGIRIIHNRGIGNVVDNDVMDIFRGQSDSDTTASAIQTGIKHVAANVTHATRRGELAFYTQSGGSFLERVRIDSLGNVGIGTTTPTAELDVAGTASVSALTVRGSSPGYIDQLNGNDLIFRTSVGGDTGLSEKITLTNAGYVGIGTTAPEQTLEIRNASYTQARFQSINGTGNAGGIEIWGDDASSKFELQAIPTDNGILPGGFLIYDRVDSQYRFVINTSGNVGIGTTDPVTTLDVAGNATIGNSWNTTFTDGNVISFDRDNSNYIYASNASGTLNFGAGGTSDYMTLSTTGNLQMDGDLTISGNDLFMATNTANYFLMADGTNYNPVTPASARTGLGLAAGGTGDIWVEKAGDTMTGTLIIDTSSAISALQIINGDATSTWFNYQNGSTNYIRGTTTYVDTTLDMNNNGIVDINWGASDDGSGSGLDADTIDGQSAIFDYTPGNWEVASNSNSSSYSSASLEVRELNNAGAQTGVRSEAPRIGFHWGSRVASQIGLETNGDISILNNPGTGYETLRVLDLTASGYAYAQRFVDTASSSYYVDPAATGTSLSIDGNIISNGAFSISSNGNNNITLNAGSGNVVIGASGTGKLDSGIIDPPYMINGEKYATFLSSMIGVKEELTNQVVTSEYVPGVGYRSVIDFTSQPVGSDLWLFGETSDLREHIDRLSILLSPAGNTRAWYELNTRDYQLHIYTTTPTTVSYRLTAPRFDAEIWTNTRDSSSTGFILDNDGNWATNQDGTVIGATSSLDDVAITLDDDSNFILTDLSGQVIESISTYSESVIANLRAGLINAKRVVTEELIVDGQDITSLIVSTIQSALDSGDIVSPLSSEFEDIIEANSSTIASNSQTISVLDTNVDSLTTQYSNLDTGVSSLTTSYDLHTTELASSSSIIASNSEAVSSNSSRIAYLESLSSSQQGQIDDLEVSKYDIPTSTTDLGALPDPTIEGEEVGIDQNKLVLDDLVSDYASISALIANSGLQTTDYLASTSAYLAIETLDVDNLNVDMLSINQMAVVDDNLMLTGSSIQTLANDTLFIQPIGGNINLAQGLMTLEADGQTVTINGDLTINGKLLANDINIEKDLKVKGVITAGAIKSEFGQLLDIRLATASALAIYKNLDPSPSATIDASGSATFNHLNLPHSTGTGTLFTADQNLTIVIDDITPESQVFVTFSGDYSPATKYWVTTDWEQNTFTIHLNYPVASPVDISWMIIN